jgi:hypothetical protein
VTAPHGVPPPVGCDRSGSVRLRFAIVRDGAELDRRVREVRRRYGFGPT